MAINRIETINELNLKHKVELTIYKLGIPKYEMEKRYNFPMSYYRRLGNEKRTNNMPLKAVEWLMRFVESEGNIEPYEKTTMALPSKEIKNVAKTCSKCGATDHRENAKFCDVCGSPLHSQSEIIIERLNKIRSQIGILPSATKDEIRDSIIAAVEYIKNRGDC